MGSGRRLRSSAYPTEAEANWDWFLGNLNFDSEIDSQDFGIMKDHFGESIPGSIQGVPEPGSLLLLIMGAIGILTYHW